MIYIYIMYLYVSIYIYAYTYTIVTTFIILFMIYLDRYFHLFILMHIFRVNSAAWHGQVEHVTDGYRRVNGAMSAADPSIRDLSEPRSTRSTARVATILSGW